MLHFINIALYPLQYIKSIVLFRCNTHSLQPVLRQLSVAILRQQPISFFRQRPFVRPIAVLNQRRLPSTSTALLYQQLFSLAVNSSFSFLFFCRWIPTSPMSKASISCFFLQQTPFFSSNRKLSSSISLVQQYSASWILQSLFFHTATISLPNNNQFLIFSWLSTLRCNSSHLQFTLTFFFAL